MSIGSSLGSFPKTGSGEVTIGMLCAVVSCKGRFFVGGGVTVDNAEGRRPIEGMCICEGVEG